jgi:hypothetical protein
LFGQSRQPLRQRRQRVGLDLTVGDMAEAIAFAFD